ncbi:TetR family transcriptional regulator [Rhodothalassium salexigens DSM 2132]|uniref:TetR family transcriptional regulator n=1 Tax=Rhodothalassium salexigens DSM 2132 TaxID=1188247 RepID=A0A4R2P7I1_RHOSA|nr:TetR family transcriptional regulator [Rhodothalassium salexigens]MBB4212645.1 AcrR family transcriptional regulator [Rhodothalassium salexigens DSM 2132]TCP30757.1 TetR family transcriptional regulator [Rhodothalassium salexigens DSM 2132]
MTQPPEPPAGTADGRGGSSRRQALLDAAANLFVAKGYAGTSIRDIAAAVDMLPGSVYYHFASKERLLLAVHREGVAHFTAEVEAALAPFQAAGPTLERVARQAAGPAAGPLPGRTTGQKAAEAAAKRASQGDSQTTAQSGGPAGCDSDAWAALAAACAAHLRVLLDGSAYAQVVTPEFIKTLGQDVRDEMVAERAVYERQFIDLIDRVPLAAGVDRRLFRLTLFGALSWALHWYRPDGLTPDAIAETMLTLLRRGVDAAEQPADA